MKLNNLWKKKRILGLWFLGIACFAISLMLQPSVSYSLTTSQVPNPQQVYGGWVTDMANVLSNETEDRLNQIIFELEEKNGTEIAVVTVPEIGSYPSLKTFATELFNDWGIGKEGQGNGILFLTSIGDRRVEIETGYGIGRILPDRRVGRILDDHVVPYFRNDNFNDGILAGTEALIKAVENEVFDSGFKTPLDIPNLIWLFTGSAGFLSYGCYDLATREAKKPVLVNPGDYQRIRGFDPSEIGTYTYVRFGMFSVLFTLSVIPVLWMLYSFPQFAIFSGVVVMGVLFIILGYKSNTLIPTTNKFTTLIKIVIFFLISIILLLVFNLLAWEAIAILALVVMITIGKRLTSTMVITSLALFIGAFCLFVWSSYYQQQWGYVPTLAEILSINFNQVFAGILITATISFVGCFPLGYQFIQWKFKHKNQSSLRPIYSADSELPLEPLEPAELKPLLTDHEQMAEKLGSVSFQAWWNPEIGPLSRDTIYLKAYVKNPGNQYSECPHGKELTVTSTSQTVRSPTEYTTGLRRITYECKCCNYKKETERTIPRLSSSSSSSSGGSSFGGGSSSGGSSSGGGSFGGGSSGGGGAGRNF